MNEKRRTWASIVWIRKAQAMAVVRIALVEDDSCPVQKITEDLESFSKVDHAAIQPDQNPDAETETLGDNETLRIFNELCRKNRKTELKAKG